MKITILTGNDRNMAELAELCLPSKQAWADRHGVKLHVLRDTYPTDYPTVYGHPSFQKLRHIRWWLERFDFVWWMDADSVITNPDLEPRQFVERVTACGIWPFAVSADYKNPDEDHRPWFKQWSAGHAVWSHDEDAFDLLDAAMARTEFMWSGLWDQDALQAVIDQPDHDWRPNIHPTRTMNAVLPGLTGNPEFDWQPGDFLCHFTGIGRDERAEVARRFIAEHLTPPTNDTDKTSPVQ